MDVELKSIRFEPENWEEFALFRETAIGLHVGPVDSALWRFWGKYIYLMLLEQPRVELAEATVTRSEIRAAIHDLRHLQGFIATVGRSYMESQLGADGVRLSQLAEKTAPNIGAIADSLEVALS